MLGWMRLVLRGMAYSKSGDPASHSLHRYVKEYRSEGPVLRLTSDMRMLQRPRSSWFLSPKGNYLSPLYSLSLSANQHREFN
jgi:hypothetical protein